MTGTMILLGGTAPLRGDAAFARGAAAYLAHVNARGGVRGRKVTYRLVDDGGDPARALAATQALVERDGVFAVFGSVGTETGLAVRGYLGRAGVPQLFAASGADALGGFRPSFRAEGWILGSYVARTRPRAVLGVVHAQDAEGRELLGGLREGVARTRVRLLAEPLDAAAGIEAQVAELEAAGAEAVALLVPRAEAAAAAAVSAVPLLLTADAAAAGRWPAGSVSIGWVKDPAEPRWRGDEALAPFRPLLRGRSAAHVQGMAAAHELAGLLRGAGAEPTRAAVRDRLTRLSSAANPFLWPGIAVRTGRGDVQPLEAAVLRRWTTGGWRSFGGVWRHRGR